MSLLESYQICKTSLANKLTAKGVTANGNEGLTSLINKVDDISTSQSLDSQHLLYADKSIIQNEETVNLYSLLYDNKVSINDEDIVIFDEEKVTYCSDSDFNDVVRDGFCIELSEERDEFYVETFRGDLISWNCYIWNENNSDWELYTKQVFQQPLSSNGKCYYNFFFSEGILNIYYSTDNITPTSVEDFDSSFSWDEFDVFDNSTKYRIWFPYFNNGVKIKYIDNNGVDIIEYPFYEGHTDLGGMFIQEYEGMGAGQKNFRSVSRNSQSETYGLLDVQWYDIGTTGTPNSKWGKSGDMTLVSDATGLIITNDTSVYYSLYPRKYEPPKKLDMSWNDFVCEFTYHESSNPSKIILRLSDSEGMDSILLSEMNLTDGDVVKIEHTNNITRFYKNNVQQGSDRTGCSGDVLIRFAIKSASLRFSHFMIYPI